jgi:hypothetical protein
MAIVAEISWNDILDGKALPETPARKALREAVAEIADKAHTKLPESASRIDRAVRLVLNGDVELLADGTAKVASQSNGSTAYHIVNGECPCKDYPKAPHQFCKHRLSAAIARRAQELIKAKLADTNGQAEPPSQPAQTDAPTTPLPEAPVSITLKASLHGHEVMVTLRGVDFASVKAQVEQASDWLKVQAPAEPPAQRTGQAGHSQQTGWCSKHGLQMTQNHKNGRSWWSHRLADGTWCKGR